MTNDRHYKLIDQTTTAPDGSTLYRIRALRDLPWHGVRAGDLGGYVAGTHNLAGNGWVSDRGQVFGDARVYGNARVADNAMVYGRAWVTGRAWVYGNARVSDFVDVCGNSRVYGNAWASGYAQVYGDADVSRRDHVLTISSASSEGSHATLFRTADGGHLLIDGCWDGTTADLRALADQDEWPSECDEQTCERFRPVLVAVADMCDAHMRAYEWGGVS